MSAETLDLVAGWTSLVLTLFVFSYLLGDNFLYRIAVHLLVGVTAGYVVIAAVDGVIIPWLRLSVFAEGGETSVGLRVVGVVPFLLGLGLLIKNLPRLSPLGNLTMGFIVGVGAAVAIVGAVAGTIVPLTQDAGASFEQQTFINGLVALLATIGTLVYFQYLARRRVDGTITRSRPMKLLAGIGSLALAVTFGGIYAGLMLTSLSVFSGVIAEQLAFLLEQVG